LVGDGLGNGELELGGHLGHILTLSRMKSLMQIFRYLECLVRTGVCLTEIPRPAGENAGLRDDAGKIEMLDFSTG